MRQLVQTLVFVLGVALVGGASLLLLNAHRDYKRASEIEATTAAHLAALRNRLQHQEVVLRRLQQDPAYVEKVIRQRLGYARSDEIVFRFEE